MVGDLEAKILKYSQTDVAFSITAPPLTLLQVSEQKFCVMPYFDLPPPSMYLHIFR